VTRVLRSSLLIAALVAVALPNAVVAQATQQSQIEPAKAKLIRELLKRTRAVDQSFAVMEAAMPAQRAANPRIPAVFWDRFEQAARARRGEFEAMMIDVYDRHFTTDDVRAVLAFYDTPAGAKLLRETPLLMQEMMAAGQAWGERIGQDVGEKLAAEGVRIEP
jgi:hypothetical protein